MNVVSNDALVDAMMNIRREQIKAQNESLSKYSTLEALLTYLADASPKERESFLKIWKTENAKSGVGRKKRDNTLEIYSIFIELKKLHKIKSDGKMYDKIIKDAEAKIENLQEKSEYQKTRRNQRAGFLNKISAARKQYPFIEEIIS